MTCITRHADARAIPKVGRQRGAVKLLHPVSHQVPWQKCGKFGYNTDGLLRGNSRIRSPHGIREVGVSAAAHIDRPPGWGGRAGAVGVRSGCAGCGGAEWAAGEGGAAESASTRGPKY